MNKEPRHIYPLNTVTEALEKATIENPIPPVMRKAVSLQEAAQLLSVSKATMERLTVKGRDNGGLDVVYVGSDPRVPISEIDRFLERLEPRAERLNNRGSGRNVPSGRL
jgi:excisionase family DNA binding protein